MSDRVTIFEVEADFESEGVQTLLLDGDDAFAAPYIRLMQDANSVSAHWEPPAVYIDRPTLRQPDFMYLWGGIAFVLSAEMPEDVRAQIAISGEFLSVCLDGGSLDYVHVTRVLNVMDKENTEWDEFGSSDALAFHVHRLQEVPLFRVPENNAGELFCSQGYGEFDFKSLVERHGLTGISFREAWNSDAGPIRKVWDWQRIRAVIERPAKLSGVALVEVVKTPAGDEFVVEGYPLGQGSGMFSDAGDLALTVLGWINWRFVKKRAWAVRVRPWPTGRSPRWRERVSDETAAEARMAEVIAVVEGGGWPERRQLGRRRFEWRDDGGVKVIAQREKSQAPPPSTIWETLTDPYRASARQWLVIADDEVQPTVIEAERPSLVVWSSLWPDRPNDVIRFTIEGHSGGSSLKWSLESPDDPPEDARLRQLRHRINYLINGEMRDSFDN